MPQQSYDGIKYSAVAYIYSVMIHVVTMIYCTVLWYNILYPKIHFYTFYRTVPGTLLVFSYFILECVH